MSLPQRPTTILIAALGGEGGGVMADWLVDAATRSGFPVQSTSIPGVAQRTGATTYYLEIYPASRDALGGREPVMSLTPTPGNVDMMVASELLEAARAMLENGANVHRLNPDQGTSLLADGVVYFPKASVLLLLEKGANPSQPDKFGQTPTMRLICYRMPNFPQQGEPEMVELLRALAKAGGDLKTVGISKETPLQAAEARG